LFEHLVVHRGISNLESHVFLIFFFADFGVLDLGASAAFLFSFVALFIMVGRIVGYTVLSNFVLEPKIIALATKERTTERRMVKKAKMSSSLSRASRSVTFVEERATKRENAISRTISPRKDGTSENLNAKTLRKKLRKTKHTRKARRKTLHQANRKKQQTSLLSPGGTNKEEWRNQRFTEVDLQEWRDYRRGP
jgi:hypothetical protein